MVETCLPGLRPGALFACVSVMGRIQCRGDIGRLMSFAHCSSPFTGAMDVLHRSRGVCAGEVPTPGVTSFLDPNGPRDGAEMGGLFRGLGCLGREGDLQRDTSDGPLSILGAIVSLSKGDLLPSEWPLPTVKCNCIFPIRETGCPTWGQVYQIQSCELAVLTSARMFI